jgi:hypothetical protein
MVTLKNYLGVGMSKTKKYWSLMTAEEEDDWVYEGRYKETVREDHLACYSYPNCYENPLGCHYQTKDPEEFGHKD